MTLQREQRSRLLLAVKCRLELTLLLAFILYRQHHQQAIIARNRGINNPDISKIIGEQWKAESEETKKYWQTLAQVSVSFTLLSLTSSKPLQEEKVRHHEQYPDYRYQPRRVGKPGSSPLNPSGQHTTVDKYRCPRCGGRSITTPTSPFVKSPATPSLPPLVHTEGSTPTTRYLPMMSNLGLKSPNRRRGRAPSNLSSIQVPPIREEPAMYSPASAGVKRRRFEYEAPPSSSLRRDSSYYQQYARRDSLPPIQVRYSPPNSATMPHLRTPRDGRRTSLEISPQNTGQQDQGSKNVEEILMTFPYQNKIKLLGRISLPYKETLPTNPANHVRGAIIAVEGDDLTAVKELSEWLNERLANDADASYQSRIIEPPKLPEEESANFEDYLDLIKEWHRKSKEMITYITTPLGSSTSSPDTLMSDNASKKESTASTADRKDSASPPQSSIRTQSISTSTSLTTPASSPTKPIIILPTFQLQASTTYASRIPIADAYSTTDHWQWMATLWRGTVGPDLTIYVKSHEKDSAGAKPEMDDQVRCLTVCKERGGRFLEAHLRRVGFEVGEFVKGMGGKGV